MVAHFRDYTNYNYPTPGRVETIIILSLNFVASHNNSSLLTSPCKQGKHTSQRANCCRPPNQQSTSQCIAQSVISRVYHVRVTRWSGDAIRRTGKKSFNSVSHNRARPYFRIQHGRGKVKSRRFYLNVHSVTGKVGDTDFGDGNTAGSLETTPRAAHGCGIRR